MRLLSTLFTYAGLLGWLFWPGLAIVIARDRALRRALAAADIERRNLRLALLAVLPRHPRSVQADVPGEQREQGHDRGRDEPADHDPR